MISPSEQSVPPAPTARPARIHHRGDYGRLAALASGLFLTLAVLAGVAIGLDRILLLVAVGALLVALASLEAPGVPFALLGFSFAISIPVVRTQIDSDAFVRLDDAALLLLTMSLALRLARGGGRQLRMTPLAWPLLVWWGLGACSVIVLFMGSAQPSHVLLGWFGVMRLGAAVLVYLAASSLAADPAYARTGLISLWVGALWAAGFSLFCWITGFAYALSGWPRPLSAETSTLSYHYGHLGWYLATMVFVVGAVAVAYRRRALGWAMFGSLALLLAVILRSPSRFSWLMVAVGMAALVLVAGRRARVILAGALVVGLALATAGWQTLVPQQTKQRIQVTFQPGSPAYDSIMTRVKTVTAVSRGMAISPTAPFFGYGFMQYRWTPMSEVSAGGAHNNFLHTWAELGLPGIVVFLWFLYVLFKETIRRVRHQMDSAARRLAVGFLCALVALVMTCVGQETFSVQPALGSFFCFFLFLAGVILGMNPEGLQTAKGAHSD